MLNQKCFAITASTRSSFSTFNAEGFIGTFKTKRITQENDKGRLAGVMNGRPPNLSRTAFRFALTNCGGNSYTAYKMETYAPLGCC